MVRMNVAGRWAVSFAFLVALACSETGKGDDGNAGRGGTVMTGGGGAGGMPSGGPGAAGRGGAGGMSSGGADAAGRGGGAGGLGGRCGGVGGIDCTDCHGGLYGPTCRAGQWICEERSPSCASGGGGVGGDAGGTAGRGGSGGATACSSATTLDACDARSDCHPVFEDPGNCRCASAGCCARFSRCAVGDRATCTPNGIACEVVTPHCESPYTVSYANLCYEGCVRNTECALTP
jgi:hypothetical protein